MDDGMVKKGISPFQAILISLAKDLIAVISIVTGQDHEEMQEIE